MEKSNKKIRISYSSLSSLEKCSWLYYCQYILKLPDKSNDGANRGNVVHNVFEILTKNPRHKKHVDLILRNEDVKESKPIKKLVSRMAKKYFVNDSENLNIIYDMILTGLQNDFYCDGAEEVKSEGKFVLDMEGGYEIKGFIDKTAKYKGGEVKITDYKGSKSKFKAKEIENNIQAQMYSLAYHEKHGIIPSIEFLFLRFPNDPIQKFKKSTKSSLSGFKYYLSHVSETLKNFDEEDAKKRLAATLPHPKPDEGFCGPLICGRAKFKGQLKKDGTLMWHCPQKFPYDYYAQIDSEGKVCATAFEKEELKEKKGMTIEKKHYKGCPFFNRSIDYSFYQEDSFGF